MLQQTQVATVEPYFEKFVRVIPSVQALAAAEESEVLRLWEGLGYYRRARSLHAAAKQVVELHGGKVPRDLATLQTLPGIGRYTAGAIASIAYNVRAPILEANTIRLLTRLIAYPEDPSKSAGQKLLWDFAETILPRTEVARFNQALMELGSLVCQPVKPACAECPVREHCQAFQRGLQEELPRPKSAKQFVSMNETALIVSKQGRVLLRRCAEGERWAGLWDFPRFALESDSPAGQQRELGDKLQQQVGVIASPGELLTTLKHGVTRYRITLNCYAAKFVSGRAANGARWFRPAELKALPMSTTGRKLSRLLSEA
jgi:A/G-specific adenine glycosylase